MKRLIDLTDIELKALIRDTLHQELVTLLNSNKMNPDPKQNELLKAKDVAVMLKCTVQTVHNLKRKGVIKSYRKIGRALYFERSAIEGSLKQINNSKYIS